MKDTGMDITDTVALMKPGCLERSRLRMKGTAIIDTAALMKPRRWTALLLSSPSSTAIARSTAILRIVMRIAMT